MFEKKFEVEGITEYRLENGLKVLFFPDQSKQTVTVNITYMVGSRHEGYGEAGMAHLLEHMLFKGTPTFKDIPKVLKDRGAQMNGTTSFDRTNYFETLPASNENLDFALHLEADRMINSFIAEEDLRSEMSVVQSEFQRGENNPLQVLMQNVCSASYRWHNYGKTTIGNLSDILNVPASRLKTFYKKHYRPENAMLVVAGNFDPKFAEEKILEHFGTIPNPEVKLVETYTNEPPQQGIREVNINRVGEVAFLLAGFHIPCGSSEEFAALEVLETVLSDQPSGRLYKKLVETKVAANAFAYAFSLHDPGLFFLGAMVPADDDIKKAESDLLETAWELGQNPVSDEEIERAKNLLAKQWEDQFADSTQAAVQLSEWASLGDWRLMFLHRDRIESVTKDQVQEVAAKYLVKSNTTLGRFLPSEETNDVEVSAPKSLQKELDHYKGRHGLNEGEKFDPSLENILARTQFLQEGNCKIALVPKTTRGNSVDVRINIEYGCIDTLSNYPIATKILPSLFGKGTTKHTFQQIDDLLTGYKADLSFSGNPGKLQIRLSAKKDTLVRCLDLLKEILSDSTLPEDQFGIQKHQNLTRLETRLTDPGAIAANVVTRTLSPYNPSDLRFTPTIKDQISQVQNANYQDVVKAYKELFSTENVCISVVGDFVADEVEPKLLELANARPTKQPYKRYLSDFFSVEGNQQNIDVPGKENGVLYAGKRLKLQSTDPDFYALTIGNHILGGGGLSSRLAKKVRQEDGLSYSVGSTVRASNFQPYATASFYAICNPADGTKLKQSVASVLDHLSSDGFTIQELEEAKKSYLENAMRSRNEDSLIATMLMETMDAEIDLQAHIDREKQIRNLSLDKVNAVTKATFQMSEFTTIFAGDLKKMDGSEGP